MSTGEMDALQPGPSGLTALHALTQLGGRLECASLEHRPPLLALVSAQLDAVPTSSRFLDSVLRTLANPSVPLCRDDLQEIERRVARTHPRLRRRFAEVIRERERLLNSPRTPRSADAPRGAQGHC